MFLQTLLNILSGLNSAFSVIITKVYTHIYIMAQFIHTDVSICHHIELHLYLLLFLALQSTSHIYMRIYDFTHAYKVQ